MAVRKDALATLFAVGLALEALGCGTSMSNSNRVLQSMTVTAASTSGNNSPVTFTATGTFSKIPSPSPVPFTAPYSGSWQVSDPAIATLVSTGAGDGTASFQCVGGAAGTVTVTAIASSNAASGTKASGTAVKATASLTCP
jgi:hypothetical protein